MDKAITIIISLLAFGALGGLFGYQCEHIARMKERCENHGETFDHGYGDGVVCKRNDGLMVER